MIATGGIGDARGIVAAFALGAAAVQIGTAYLFCPETMISPVHFQALKSAEADDTMVTNVFTGRPARGIVNRSMRSRPPLTPGPGVSSAGWRWRHSSPRTRWPISPTYCQAKPPRSAANSQPAN